MTDRATILGYLGYEQPEPGTAPVLHFFRDAKTPLAWVSLGVGRKLEPIYWDGHQPHTLRTHPTPEEPQ